MKTTKLIPALLLLFPFAHAPGALGGDEKSAETLLPTSCTLLAMSSADRARHLERLKMLGWAASPVAVTPGRFNFKVDLQTMPFKELQTWARAEQSCCSFLKIDSQVTEADRQAVVGVVCPEIEEKEVLETFGLKPQS